MRTAAILPVKRFTAAKRRLGADVADPLRAELARAMVGDVLSALRHCTELELTIVVTNEAAVASAARYLGATVVPDTAEDGQSAAVELGVAEAVREGFERVLCIPGDCPALDPGEVDELLHGEAHRDGERDGDDECRGKGKRGEDGSGKRRGTDNAATVVIVPDRHGTGTNGLLLAPPDAIAPSFGPDSCERHRGLARAAGAACEVRRAASLLLDIDTGADLDALRERLRDERHWAPRTRTVLRGAHLAQTSRAA